MKNSTFLLANSRIYLKLPLEKGMGFFGRLRSLRMTEKNAQNDKIKMLRMTK